MVGYDRKRLGEFLRVCRTDGGFSQKEIALKLGLDTPQFISNIERGLCAIPFKKLKALLKIYKRDVDPVIELIASSYSESLRGYFFKSKSSKDLNS